MSIAKADRLLAEAVGSPCTEFQLASFEADIGTSLPVAYRRFLAHRNGGVLRANVVGVPGWVFPQTDVYALFGLDRRLETCDLRWNREVLRRVTGTALLPIACDAGGSPFCVELGSDAGRIVYVPLEQPSARHVVADCFEEFLQAIRPPAALSPASDASEQACVSASMRRRAARMGLCAA